MSYRQRIEAIRRTYAPEKRQSEFLTDLPSFFVYRPISTLVTPAFLAGNVSATVATLVGLLLALAMPVAAGFVPEVGAWLVAALVLAYQIVDCVDGNIARVTSKQSSLGHMIDGISTLCFWCLLFVSCGILARNASNNWLGQHGLEIGLALAALFLLQREIEDTFEWDFGKRVRWEPPTPALLGTKWSVARIGRVMEHTYIVAGLPLASTMAKLDLFLAIVAVYQAALFAWWLARYVRELRLVGEPAAVS